MTNREWIESLDEFQRAVVVVNFGRSVPEHLQDNGEYVRRQYNKWLSQDVDNDDLYRVKV